MNRTTTIIGHMFMIFTFLSSVQVSGKEANFRPVQTGPYAKHQKLPETTCSKAIKFAVNNLAKYFPEYSFVISPKIKKCKNLKNGIKALVKSRKRVIMNLNTFHTPLHSIFLSNKTKFNHNTIGEMGLHIDVNKKGEIKKRLINFRINPKSILHEKSNRVSLGKKDRSTIEKQVITN